MTQLRIIRSLSSVLATALLLRAHRVGGSLRWKAVVSWLSLEVLWHAFMRFYLIPLRIQGLRVKDAGKCQPDAFDRTVDLAEAALRRDPRGFWKRLTKIASADRIPRDTVKSYTKSLLYVSPDADLTSSKAQLIESATNRLENASPRRFSRDTGTLPQAISGWVDDQELRRIVRSTPLAVCVGTELSVAGASAVLLAAGWGLGLTCPRTGFQLWTYQPVESNLLTPILMFPGLGCGYVSFLPLALYFQRQQPKRTLVLLRTPWSELGMPLEPMPQWDDFIDGIIQGVTKLGVASANLVAHSYGTCIANRLLRRLSGLDADEGYPKPIEGFSSIRGACLLEPMIFGDTAVGLSCGFCNLNGPDINTAALSNRGGVPWKETMFFDPTQHGQCLHGINVYAAAGDVLLDVACSQKFCNKHIPSAHFELDETRGGFHGRCIMELWCGGSVWGAPCASRCLAAIQRTLD